MKLRKSLAVSAAAFLFLAGCSSDGDDASPADKRDSDIPVEDWKDRGTVDADDIPDGPDGSGSGVQSATLEMDSETIELSGGGCYLEPQDSATGGQILFTGQAVGVTGDGEELTLDVSRWDEDSIRVGDITEVVIGDYKGPDSQTYSTFIGSGEDFLSLDGSTISADDVELTNERGTDDMTVSLEVNC